MAKELIEQWIDHNYELGLTVTMKEKYGSAKEFICNVVMEKDGHFILTNRDGVVADLPCGNWAVVKIKHNESTNDILHI